MDKTIILLSTDDLFDLQGGLQKYGNVCRLTHCKSVLSELEAGRKIDAMIMRLLLSPDENVPVSPSSGIVLIEQLKEKFDLSKIIILTTASMMYKVKSAMNLGVREIVYLDDPYFTEILFRKLQEILQKQLVPV
ncbi:hypothetical protein KKG31_07180 [Patescibacteria group bacterium]|nr:hypothetical protein [Patescibacteria group bacterium]MBU1758862.1 hypothetical protein [Patescibacteria group bacterium]